jgi:hypothetical protein
MSDSADFELPELESDSVLREATHVEAIPLLEVSENCEALMPRLEQLYFDARGANAACLSLQWCLSVIAVLNLMTIIPTVYVLVVAERRVWRLRNPRITNGLRRYFQVSAICQGALVVWTQTSFGLRRKIDKLSQTQREIDQCCWDARTLSVAAQWQAKHPDFIGERYTSAPAGIWDTMASWVPKALRKKHSYEQRIGPDASLIDIAGSVVNVKERDYITAEEFAVRWHELRTRADAFQKYLHKDIYWLYALRMYFKKDKL